MRPDQLLESTVDGLPEAVQDRLARILDDYLVAAENGSPISPAELLERHPNDAEHLRVYLSGLQLFHAAAIVPGGGGSTSLAGDGQLAAQTIGDFRLLREIGRGGMGVVYEAMQISLRRRVALKILPFNARHDAKQIGRFRNEAQAAAQVQHPNIVPVFAVGEQDGVHYYAMQLVEGQSLTTLLEGMQTARASSAGASTTAPNHLRTICDAHPERPSNPSREPRTTTPSVAMNASRTSDHMRAIARLGIQAAEALHAAHEYGIVHRDVKPSNLLVDDQGKLWVADFGLARCRETRGLTQTGDILGTMRYMSPEQALGRAALIDHRTDVFSLGLTLYELATLHHPAGELTDAQHLLDRARFAWKPLRQWNRHIPVDFQTIVLKAIAEFPHERYATAQEMADDLRRFLEGKPIQASPPSFVNRAAKWTGRHRGFVGAAAAIAVVAFTALLASMFIISQEKVETERARLLARVTTLQRNAVFGRFNTGLVDQLAAIPGAEGVRYQLLEDSLELLQQFEQQAVGDPSLATDLALAYSKMGSLHEKLGNHKEAIEKHIAARSIWEARVVAEPENFEFARNLALCHNNIGLLLAESGRGMDALASLEAAFHLQQMLLTSKPSSEDVLIDTATTKNNWGLVLRQTGSWADAVKRFREAIAIQERLIERSPESEAVLRGLAVSYNNLGSLHESTNAKVAIDAYQKAISIQRRLVKSQTINRIYQGDLARTYNNLGYVLAQRQDWNNAELCYVDAIRIQENLVKSSPLAASYRRDLAISYNNLGMLQSQQEQFAKAEPSFRQALKLQKLLLSAEPTDSTTLSNLGGVFNNLGRLFDRQRRFAEAEASYQQAIRYQRQALKATPDVAAFREMLSNHYLNYARCLESQKKSTEAAKVTLQRKELAINSARATPLN